MYKFLAYGITYYTESYNLNENSDVVFMPIGKEKEVVIPKHAINSGYVLMEIVDSHVTHTADGIVVP